MKHRIAIVDDEPRDIQPLEYQLKQLGHDVEIISSASEALKRSDELFAACSLAVVDIAMPTDGVFSDAESDNGLRTGALLIKQLRLQFPTLRFVALSVLEFGDMEREPGMEVVVNWIRKPFILTEAALVIHHAVIASVAHEKKGR